MPFDEDEDTTTPIPKVGLKNVSSQKSIFDNIPKKPTQEEFDQKVKEVEKQSSSYKSKVAELAVQFNKLMADKTLPENKTFFQKDLETELLRSMANLAREINNDRNVREGEGSLGWVTLLLKTCFAQRDKLNKLEYTVDLLNKRLQSLDISNETK